MEKASTIQATSKGKKKKTIFGNDCGNGVTRKTIEAQKVPEDFPPFALDEEPPRGDAIEIFFRVRVGRREEFNTGSVAI